MASTEVKYTIQGNPGDYWFEYRRILAERVLPYQWQAINDELTKGEPSHAIQNFRIAAGLEKGDFHGFVFQDSDVGKWIEAVAWHVREDPDPVLQARVEGVVDIMAKAQEPDGYLNTFYIIKEPGKRFTNLQECHELYSAGHLLEGAVAWFRATGSERFLDIMRSYMSLIHQTFGPGEGQIHGYDGHEEIELALLELYQVDPDRRWLDLARYFIDQRGQQPNFLVGEWESRGRLSHWTGQKCASPGLEYHQAHRPVRQQTEAVGHAVRGVYLYTAMAALARLDNDDGLRDACQVLWQDMVGKKLYIHGGIGSTHHGEAFTQGWDLPNDTIYAETCASVGLVFFARQLLADRPDARVADVVEQVLYNLLPAAMSLDGQSFFYVNPLEVWPEASQRDPGKHHVKARRQPWFACACCPPNLARLLASLDRYLAGFKDGCLYLHQYVSGHLDFESGGEAGTDRIGLEVHSCLPFGGKVTVDLPGGLPAGTELGFRIPGWAREWGIRQGDTALAATLAADGYVHLAGPLGKGTRLELELELDLRLVEAHPRMRANAQKACLMRGPVVYCLEEWDNGPDLPALRLDPRAAIGETSPLDFPGSPPALELAGWRLGEETWNAPYRGLQAMDRSHPVVIKAIPYGFWGNRHPGQEMLVWMPLARD